jgi:formylglycine-generating enzyme required for sulfatase activity
MIGVARFFRGVVVSRASTSVCLALVAAVGLVPRVTTPAAPVPPPAAKNFAETLKPADQESGDAGVKFEMVYIPGGDFVMGSPADEPGRDANEGPSHRVRVAGFWMGKCEVTWDEFDLFMLDENYLRADAADARKLGLDAITRPTSPYVDETYDHGREGHPVLSITHHAAMMYCHWLRKKTGRDYRLPTEAEWEYAARAGKGESAYFFGNDPKELKDYAWFKDNSPDEENFPDRPKGCTHKVGTRKPNPFGLCDMYGNVWEWTLDQYDARAYATRAANKLSIRPITLPTTKRWSHVVRGGSWADKPEKLRSATRRVSDVSWQKHDPCEPRSIWWLTRMDVIGFRVVLPAEEQRELGGLLPMVRKQSE